MRKALLITVLVTPFVFNTVQGKPGNFKETCDARDVTKIEVDVGSLVLTSKSSATIDLECEFDMSGDLSYEPSVVVKDDHIRVTGKVEGSSGNRSRKNEAAYCRHSRGV